MVPKQICTRAVVIIFSSGAINYIVKLFDYLINGLKPVRFKTSQNLKPKLMP